MSHAEGNSGTTSYTFTVTRSGGAAGAVSVSWAVQYPGGAGSANAVDLTGTTSGTLNFADGETSKTITVTVSGDTDFEPDETFNILLSNATGGATISDATGVGTITNDDAAQPGTLAIDDVGLAEGDSGTTIFTFTVTRSDGSDGAVSATWTLNAPGGDGYADGSDFAGGQPMTGTVSFADGQTTAIIEILVQGDTVYEDVEEFSVTLSSPIGGAMLGDDTGVGLIINDDVAPDTPPEGTDNSIIGTEDTPYVFTLDDFPFNDGENDALTHVRIASLPALGTLYVNGIALAEGENVAVEDIIDGVFTYLPAANGNGLDYASFTFQVVVTGGVADPTPNVLTINLTPQPDPAAIGGTDTGAVTEDGTTSASGALTVSDPDDGEEGFQTQSNAATAYGNFSIDAGGNWSYQLDNGNAAVQALNDGETLTDSIQVLSLDGTAHAVVITIHGANEPVPPITLDLDGSLDGIDYAGAFTEQGAAAAISNAAHIETQSGTVSSLIIQLTDGTAGDQLTFDSGLVPGGFIVNASATQIAIFGIGSAATYEAILASVRYTNGTDNPTLNGNTDRVISVVAGDHVSGQNSPTAYATIAVTAVNDLPTIGGQAAGDIYEDATFSTSGQLTISDPDANEARFQAMSVSGTYGSFQVSESGAWSYAANANQFMRGGQDYTDTFRVWSFDNSSYVDVVVTSHGNDDAPNIFIAGGNTVGYVYEDGVLIDGHTVPINDPDENESGWVSGDFTTAYGTFHIETNGTWTYTLDNDAPALLTLNSGQHVTDTHLLTSLGGNQITLQVQVNGANEPPGPPVLVNPIADVHVFEDNAVSYQVPADAFADPDNAITYSADLVGGGGLPAWLSFDANTRTFSGTPPLNYEGTLSIRVTVSDGTDSAYDDFDLIIDPVNDAPTITGIQGDAIAYIENSGLVLLDLGANAVLSDPDSGNFAGGSLTVGIYENYTGSESITPFTGGAVTPSSGNVLVNGINIGTGGSAGMYYVVNFNANATAALVQILLRSFGYRNNSDNPPTATKSFAWTLVDGDGTANGGSDTVVVTSTLTITSVNDAPTGSDKTITLLEDGSYTIVAADFGFADVENNGLAGAVITTVPGAGTLTLNGVAVTAGTFVTAADIAAGKLVFTPAANGSGNGYASLTFQVRDTGGTANGGVDTDQSPNSLTFNVTPVNDAPVVNNIQGDAAIYLEGSAPVPLNLGADALIIDDNANFNGGSLTVGIDDATYFPPQDRLTPFTGAVTAGGGVNVNGVNIGTYGSGGRFFVINFNANATAERVQILLNSIAYNNSAGDNPIAGRRDIVWTLIDGGGTANGGQDSITFTTSVTVGAINDAPSGIDATITVLEGGSHTFSAADFAYTDPENNGLAGVIITTLPVAGSLTLNGNGFAAGTFVTAAELAAGQLVFTPAPSANGLAYAGFTFQVRDNGGTADGGQDTDQTANTITLDVVQINEAPAGTDGDLYMLEDGILVFTVADFGFTDPANSLLAVQITTLPAAGMLLLNGVAVTAGQFVAASAIDAGQLTFQPGPNANGFNYAHFTFQVQDDGGTGNGGVDLDPTPNTISVHVTPVADAPSGTDSSVTILEDSTYILTVADFGFTDVLDGNSLLGVRFTTVPASGVLFYNGGQPLSANTFISVADLASGAIRYTPPANANGANLASFTFQVVDNGIPGNGGEIEDPTPNTLTFNVTPVSDAPSGTDTTRTIFEDDAYTFSAADFGFSDVDGDAFVSVRVVSAPFGLLLLDELGNGEYAILTTGDYFQVSDLNLGRVRFAPANNGNGTPYASFTFQVQDSGSTENGGVILDSTPNTFTFNVTPVNDAAVITGDTIGSVTEAGGTYNTRGGVQVATGDLNAADVDNPADTWQPVTAGAASVSGYGTYSLDASGHWAYMLDNDNAAVEALAAGQTLTDTFTALTADGTAQTVTVTIHGQNDAPANVTSGPITVNEDQPVQLNGLAVGDVDGPPGDTYTVTLSVQHGTLTIRTDVSGGITASNIIGGGSGMNGLTITGTLAQINATLAVNGALSYQGDPNFNGADSLRMSSWEGVPADPASFTASSPITTGTGPVHLITADVNGDGLLDLVYTVGGSTSQAAYRLGNGNGTFGAETMLSGGNNVTSVAVGDVDGDGRADIVVANYAGAVGGAGSAGIYYGAVGGGFGPIQSLGSISQAYDVIIADMNGDGRADIIVDRRDTGQSYVILQTGTPRSFTAPVAYSNSPNNYSKSIITGDFNNDGIADLVAVNPGSSATGNPPGSVTIRFGAGNGTLGTLFNVANSASTNIRYWEAAAADINNDGNLDLVVTSLVDFMGFSVFMGDGAGNFTNAVQYSTGANTTSIQMRDLNGDGILDAVFTTQGNPGGTGWRLGNGNGTFQAAVTLPGGFNPESVAVGDFDGDGYMDFASVAQSDNSLRIFTNNGTNLGDTDTVAIAVNAVNDAPSGTDATRTILEDGSYTFAAADFGFSDPVEGNSLFEVVITTLPGVGTLRLGATSVTAGQHINVADIPLLTYTAGANGNGAAYAGFTFQVRDNGGTANGGVDTDPTPNSFTFNVTPVNDAPTIANLNGDVVTFIEGSSQVGLDLGMNADFNDVDSADFVGGTMTVSIAGGLANEYLSFVVDSVITASFGNVTYFGNPFGTFSGGNDGAPLVFNFDRLAAMPEAIEALIQRLTYFNNSQNPVGGPRQITITFSDGDGTANGGADTVTVNTTVNVVPVNDAPVLGGDGTQTYVENGTPVVVNANITIADADDTNLVSAFVAISGNWGGSQDVLAFVNDNATLYGNISASFSPGSGGLTLSSANGTATLAQWQAALRAVTYSNNSDNPSGPVRGIDFTVNDGDGNSNTVTTALTVIPVNDAPTATNLNGEAAVWREGDGTILLDVDGNAALADLDSANFAGGALRVEMDGLIPGQDVLYIQFGGIVTTSGSQILVNGVHVGDFAHGGSFFVISLTANATPAAVQELIRATTYSNLAGDNPTGGTRTVTWTLTDGDGTANGGVDKLVAISTLDVRAVNDAPSGIDQVATIAEDGAYVFSAADFGFTDAEGNGLLAVRLVTLPAAGTLTLNGDMVVLGELVPIAALNDGGLVFRPAPEGNGNAYASFTFQVHDDGGTANGGDNVDQTPNSFTFNVTAVNDAPVLDASPNLVMPNILEDPGAPLGQSGALVASLVDGAPLGLGYDNVVDVDAGAQFGIAITGIAAGGTLYYTTNGGMNWIALTSASDSQALLLAADTDTRIAFVPSANFNGVISNVITFRAWDRTMGTAGTLADTTVNGGTTAFSTATDMVALGVLSVNDAPSGADKTITMAEDGTYVFAIADFGFTDVDGNQLLEVVLSTTPTGGTLYLDSDGPGGAAPVALGATSIVSASQIAAGHVYFVSAANGTGTAYGNLQFQVRDNGGTANGGSDIDITPDMITFDVIAVNDAPVFTGLDGTPTYTEDGAAVLLGSNVTVLDVELAASGNYAGATLNVARSGGASSQDTYNFVGGTITYTGASASGTLTSTLGGLHSIGNATRNNGTFSVTFNANATQADVNAVLQQLAYANSSENPAGSIILNYTFTDGNGGAQGNGGLGTATGSVTVNLTPVNDAPSGANNTLAGSEEDPVVFTVADFGFSDPVDGGANSLLAVRIASLPSAGALYLDSDGPGGSAPVAVVAGQFVSAADIAAGHFYFLGAVDGFGSPYASFTFQVQDNGGTANGGVDLDPTPNAITINLIADNMAPVVDLNGGGAGIDYATSFTEDGPAVAIGSGAIVSDPDSGIGDLIESATITLIDRVAGDTLVLGTPLPGFSIATVGSAGAITIQITGTGTAAQYQQMIQSITYATTSQDPTVGGTHTSRTITVTVGDGAANSAVATATININAVDDAPVAQPDAFTITESGTITNGNLFANNGAGGDSDPDGPTLSISAVNGSGANVGGQITLASGALLTVNANGTFSYDPNGAFLSTPTPGSGASNTPAHDSFTYTLAAGNTVTVTITLTGLDTDDVLRGTAGTDVLSGGLGNDTYHVENTADQVLESAGQGNDRIVTSVSYAIAAGISVETLEAAAGTAALALVGNEIANTLIGNAGANILSGGGGADLMIGHGGNDTYYVDNAGDVATEAVGEGFDAVYTSVSYTLAAGSEVEWFSTAANGATDPLNLTGNSLAQYIIGNAGANVINGGGGGDVLRGLGGNDTYIIADASAVTQEQAGGGFDAIYTTGSYALANGTEIEWLSAADNAATSALNLSGNEIANYLVGNAGTNVLDGGAGADFLYGLGGNDTYYVDNAGDQPFESVGNGFDAAYVSVSYALAAGQEIEWLSTVNNSAADAIDLTGNEFANYLVGNAGANVLDGKGGDDILIGNAGADTFAFTTVLGAGNVDLIVGFEQGVDKIALDDAIFTAIGGLGALSPSAFVVGSAAADASDRIIYNSLTGQLFYDADGNGASAAVQFATLSPGLTLTAGDFTVF